MLICIGEVLVDIFDDGHREDIFPGGAPFNVAVNALNFSKEVSFYGTIGNDENGRLIYDFINTKSFKEVNIKTLNDRYTTRAIVKLDNGERSFHFERSNGADYIFDITDIDVLKFKDNDIIHIGSLMLSKKEGQDFFENLIKEIRRYSKAKISFDVNYRDDIFSSSLEAKQIFLEAIKKVDIIKFSLEEVNLFSNQKDISSALKEILNENQIALVTLGSKGSLYYHNEKLITANSINVKPIDTTGAGDAFYSYFLASIIKHSILDDDEKIKYYLKRANVVGALATLNKGAILESCDETKIDELANSICD